ncbi:hypothetical protein ACFQ0E_07550 [Lysobacter brunescens]|uniref:Uncharacterized protein n=1 Tax=Lysobacter brunescens TaxID=262323 RepID=A0ABW2YC32_9GAMM
MDEEHAAIVIHGIAEHQSARAFFVVVGHFHCEPLPLQLHPWFVRIAAAARENAAKQGDGTHDAHDRVSFPESGCRRFRSDASPSSKKDFVHPLPKRIVAMHNSPPSQRCFGNGGAAERNGKKVVDDFHERPP